MKQKMCLQSVIRNVIAAGVLSAALLSLTVATQAADDAGTLAQWREAIAHTNPRAAGCFEASYPSMRWNKVECVEAPDIPFIPRSGRAGGLRVGDGHDYAAEVSSGLISKTVGSFPKVTGVKSETGIDGANSYSLQLNSNFMSGNKACDGAKDPPNCLAWLQYVYSSDYTEAFMQYWLINWDNTCPSGWNSYSGDCYTNSAAVTVPKEVITKLKTLSVSGSAVANGLDTLIMYVGKKAYKTTGKDSVVYLSSGWTESEFNVVGDGGGSEANFNSGSSITVESQVTNGTTNAPICASNAGTTGETNNLNLGSCSGTGGATPYIEFAESITPTSAWTEFHTTDMERWNPNEHVLNVNNVGNLGLDWSYATRGEVYSSSPAVANGVVYVGSEDNNVYALNASNGAKLWNYPTSSYVDSSPAIANGVVYVGSDDGNLYALKASTGVQVWSYRTGLAVFSSPAVENGVVYVGSDDGNVYALNASTGAKLWNYNIGQGVESSPAVANGVVYVSSDDGNVYALDASTGTKLWSYNIGLSGGRHSSPAVANGVVYVGSWDNNVYALEASTGAKLWSYSTGSQVFSSPAAANGVVYVGSEDGNLYALNASTGAKLWNYTTGGYVDSSPAVANGVVYVGSTDNNVYALNASTGAKLWNYTTGRYVYSSPAVANGVVYVGSVDGTVYAFGLK